MTKQAANPSEDSNNISRERGRARASFKTLTTMGVSNSRTNGSPIENIQRARNLSFSS
jgi:hypothetical protein